MLRRMFCAFLAGGAVGLVLLIFLFVGPGKAAVGISTVVQAEILTANTISEPTLTPTYAGLCSSFWYSFTNSLGNQAYLTLNAFDGQASANTGEWRPNLLKAGYYLVEVYIPSHSTISWSCPNFSRIVTTDTSKAKYIIRTDSKVLTVTMDQSMVHNAWKSLGRFAFQAGSGGSVKLTDITGEPNYDRTVSFSAMRFTYIGPTLPIYLPVVANDSARAVAVESVTALDGSSRIRNAFTPQETIYWTAKGVNGMGSPSEVTYTTTLESPCAAPAVSTGKLTVPVGNWTQVFTTTANTCTGLYNYTFQINHKGFFSSQKTGYSVNLPGFDICTIPTIPQMQTWWNLSPYYSMNLYTGGVSLSGCVKVHPDINWVRQASQQGWTFIPTWVGLQAPCYSWLHPMSWDPNVSRQQGIGEANQAAAASRALGFNGPHTIYFDMEYFPSSNSACLSTVRSFLQGWIDQMHILNLIPGVYGIASDFNRWATLNPPPERAWLAAWYSPYYFDPNASPWMPSYLSNNLWSNHQRLRQYNGDHYETWGGVQLGIDSDVADTNLVSAPTSNLSLQGEGLSGDPVEQNDGQSLQAIQQVAPGQGWGLKAGRLYWTEDNGRTWSALIAPDQGLIVAADFTSETRGWAASRNLKTGAVQLYQTSDRGKTWTTNGPGLNPEDPPVASISLSSLDAHTGYATYNFQTGSSFSLGVMFLTRDGGATWSRLALPAGGKIRFTSQLEGWLQGGPGGEDVYHTSDGGQTWQLLEAGNPALDTAGLVFAGISERSIHTIGPELQQALALLPAGTLQSSFSDTSSGWALVQEGNCSGIKIAPGQDAGEIQPFSCFTETRFLSTIDGGYSWNEPVSLP